MFNRVLRLKPKSTLQGVVLIIIIIITQSKKSSIFDAASFMSNTKKRILTSNKTFLILMCVGGVSSYVCFWTDRWIHYSTQLMASIDFLSQNW